MDSQAKRLILTSVICLIILIGWTKLQEHWYPPPPPATQPDEAEPAQLAEPFPAGPAPTTTGASIAAREPAGQFAVVGGDADAPVTLGSDRADDRRNNIDNPYEFAVTIDPRGAGVSSVRLANYRNHVPKDKKNPAPDPYELLNPVKTDGGTSILSFATLVIKLVDQKQTIDLEDAIWTISKAADDRGETAELSTVIRQSDANWLRVVKTYRVEKQAKDDSGGQPSPHLNISHRIENLSAMPLKIVLTQRGPIGLRQSDPQRDERRVVSAVVDESGRIQLGRHAVHSDIIKLDSEMEFAQGEARTLWVSVGNKYFAGIVSPLPLSESMKYPAYLSRVAARTPLQSELAGEDLTFEMTFSPESAIPAGQALVLGEEVYLGPKSHKLFESLKAAQQRNYDVIYDPERAWCMFKALATAMLWLLNGIHAVVRNYGIAIICLVLVVRAILHPVTKRGQINMMKMQKGMAALKPKIEAIQQQHKNDKQKLNEETMKLYREEGINPAGQMLGCLPLFLQMPVWVALWSTLNTNVDMRHEPFFGWIRDLSEPDALISFGGAIHIPLISSMMGPLSALNILPIIMAITMYAQQKISQKLAAPATPPPKKYDDQGREIPDPMAQQQKIMGFMMIFFGFMFYNLPSGLNLYILTSNLLGMGEQYWIKKQLKRKEAAGEFEPKKKAVLSGTNKPSFFERLQQKAEEARRLQSQGGMSRGPKKKKKQPRF